MREELLKFEFVLADFNHRLALYHKILDLWLYAFPVNILVKLILVFFRKEVHVRHFEEKYSKLNVNKMVLMLK